MPNVSNQSDPQPERRPDLGTWRPIFERSLNPMLISNDERELIDANPAACLLLRTRRADLRRRRIDDLTAPEARGDIASQFGAFLAEGSQAGPFTLLLPDQTRLEVDYAATANIQTGQHLSIFFVWPSTEGDGEGDAELAPDYQAALEEQAGRSFTLSTREREVLTLLALGDDGEKIAADLFISPATVRTHIQNARHKLGATTRAHAIALALRDHEISIGLASSIPSRAERRGRGRPDG
jgi:DNA-binding CsgD family transcriptional regulator